MENNRILYMDPARSILMLLGVVLHAANVYAVSTSWVVNDPDNHQAFDWITAVIHEFRMPTFFLISGFFCSLTLDRYGVAVFLQKRLPRIALPILAVWGFIIVPRVYMTNSLGYTDVTLWPIDWNSLWENIYHLWFLFYILLYFLVAPFLAPVIRLVHSIDRKLHSSNGLIKFCLFMGFSGLFLGGFLALVMAAYLKPYLYEGLRFFGSLYHVLYYFLFFLAGMLLKESVRVRAAFLTYGWLLWLLVFAAILTLSEINPHSFMGRAVTNVYGGALALASVHLTLFIFSRFFDRPSKLWLYLSDASYSVYLLHHGIVILAAIGLMGTSLPVLIKFLIVCVTGFLVPLALHEYLILRIPVLRLLFNGRRV
ncbi:acyltransferase family protein [Kordiimonas pumila]|uniref:Acyltransferase family protein n=1 Tax=Kordiimonas pumila TaxID=2161677 RepID=A0ABV7D1K9_9PROT|nr:acyltransferase family protein [Kordiimonas pumila]